jgi:pyridoxal phosphate enzyme, YggS family
MTAISENLRSVHDRIEAACKRSRRDARDITLVAVTKTVTPVEVAELYSLGVRDFGENRVADGLAHKNALRKNDSRWHLIGHLQRNKAAEALAGGFRLIHSVESVQLIDVLQKECDALNISAEILLEANVSGEASKYGVTVDDLAGLLEHALGKSRLTVRGLMTMAPFSDNPEDSRPHFRALRQRRDALRERFGVSLPDLSMGMTGDFEVAVEEGATMVRVGTALFAPGARQ